MDEEKGEILTEEVNEIIRSRIEFINRHYLSVRDAYKNHYDWPELDPLRHEISLCIIFGFCQAAITLSNHFLESLLKYALIIRHSEDNEQSEEEIKGRVVTSLVEKYKEGIELYGDANLNKTINCACTLGLISKKQKKHLHEFRDRFRNAYGHSDKKKTFGESSLPVTGVKLEQDRLNIDEISEPKVSELLVGQGIIQATMAQHEAPLYFLYINALAREIREKLFGPINNLNSGMTSR